MPPWIQGLSSESAPGQDSTAGLLPLSSWETCVLDDTETTGLCKATVTVLFLRKHGLTSAGCALVPFCAPRQPVSCSCTALPALPGAQHILLRAALSSVWQLLS